MDALTLAWKVPLKKNVVVGSESLGYSRAILQFILLTPLCQIRVPGQEPHRIEFLPEFNVSPHAQCQEPKSKGGYKDLGRSFKQTLAEMIKSRG